MEQAKRAVGQAAAELIEHGMIVGLGSGTTAAHFIEALRLRRLRIQTVASSRTSADLAKKLGLPLIDINEASHIDLTVDGADEIDPQKRMIKGGGGAHVREKILASSSREMVVIVDETKLVPALGKTKLPVEVLFYGAPATRAKLEQAGYQGEWRMSSSGSFFITENGNLLFDIHFLSPPASPEEEHLKILQIPGVVDTGFFFHLAGRVFVGKADGSVSRF